MNSVVRFLLPTSVKYSFIKPLSYHHYIKTLPRVSVSSMSNATQVARFALSDSSALVIQMGDITKWSVDGSSDAIVNPANERMLGGGGADGAIHRVAGPQLLDACYGVPEVQPGVRCPTGEARITPGFRLPAAYVIHTVGPIYGYTAKPKESLKSAYRNSLSLAKENNIQYIAFTAISCGVYRYPFDEAASIAISTVKEFANDFKEVHFVLFSDDIYDAWLTKARELLEGKQKVCLGLCFLPWFGKKVKNKVGI